MYRTASLAIFGVALAGPAALAAAGDAPAAEGYVTRADANGDGVVSLHELRAAYYADPAFNARIEAAFRRFDRDGDGVISAAEAGGPPPTPATPAAEPAAPAPASPPATAARPALQLDSAGLSSASRRPPPSVAAPTRPRAAPAPSTAVPVAPVTTARPANPADAWLRDIDTDGNGRASARELLASGGGQRWFSDAEFEAADRDDNGELEAAELEALMRSLERRRR